MTTNQIIKEELKHYKDKNLFTLGDKETLKMLKYSFTRILKLNDQNKSHKTRKNNKK